MKKGVLVLAGVVIVLMSCLSNIALSISEDSQWTPYVLRWDQKLPMARKAKPAKKQEPITVCSQKTNAITATQQR